MGTSINLLRNLVAVGLPIAVYGVSEWSCAPSPAQKESKLCYAPAYAPLCQATGRGMRLLLNLHVLFPPRWTRVVSQLLFMDYAIQTEDANAVCATTPFISTVVMPPLYFVMPLYISYIWCCFYIQHNNMICGPFQCTSNYLNKWTFWFKHAVGGWAHRLLQLPCQINFECAGVDLWRNVDRLHTRPHWLSGLHFIFCSVVPLFSSFVDLWQRLQWFVGF